MDPLSQAVVGATFSVAACRRKEWVKPAMIAAIVGGMLPDADILIRSSSDSLLAVEYHRHFTHALAFIPIGGLLAAIMCWPLLRKRLPFLWLYLFATLGYATHGILDSMTNYGTHLLWPFTNRRESWSIISIVDPIFTLTLVALCALAYRRQSRRYVVMGALFACIYWSLGVWQLNRATDAMMQLASQRAHTVERHEIKPSLGNLLVWRMQYEYAGEYYIDAVRLAPWAEKKYYEGGKVMAFSKYESLERESRAYLDLQRFAFFSDGWLAELPGKPWVIGDMRFAMLPNGTAPLWALAINPDAQEEGGQFVSTRQSRSSSFETLWAMISGRDLPAQDILASN